MTDEELWRMTHATHSGENDALYVGKSLLDTAAMASLLDESLDADEHEPTLAPSETAHDWEWVKSYFLLLDDPKYLGATRKIRVMRCRTCGQIWRHP